MTIWDGVFSNRHAVLPVVHVESEGQALHAADVARAAGADGVFLINHSVTDRELLEVHSVIADVHADWWIGVNCLGVTPARVFESITPEVRGVWVDNAQIDEASDAQPEADRIDEIRRRHAPRCLYFGGVAFKYQRPVEEVEAACRNAARHMDVVTTSGPGTGFAADLDKIRRMNVALREATQGEIPLAIASGITPENVGEYLPLADAFLVATGVSRSFTEFDPQRLRALVDRVRAF